jgi:hypothetical protein
VTSDDDVDVLCEVRGLGQGRRHVAAAAAVVAVDDGDVLAWEDIAGMHDPQRREDDPRVAVRVPPTEVVQVDLVRALADRQLVGERALRQASAAVCLENRLRCR